MPLSTMQDYPLTIRPILEHGRTIHANSKVITFTGDGYVESTFAEVADRADQLAAALTRLGVQARRPGRHLHVEQPDPPRGLSGRAVHGRRAAHLEHPAVPRATELRHQPRRGSGDHRRRLDHPVARQGPRSVDDGEAHHRQGCRRHVGARRDPGLRHAARSREARLRLPRRRRAQRNGDVLHERHHGQPEGGDVQPSQHLPALADGDLDGQHRPRRERPDVGHRPDVPCQRVGHAVRGVDGRRRPGVPPAVPAGRAARPHHRGDPSDADGCGADGADRSADQWRGRRPVVVAARDVRRLGSSAGA